MIVDRIEPYYGKRSRYRVCLEGEADLVLYAKELGRYGIEEGSELSDETYERIISEVLIPRARKRAMHLLEKQDRTVKNLSDKLREGGFPERVVEDAVGYVSSFHYLDDERYAENYVRYHQDGKSKSRIRQDLMRRGVDRDTIDAALDEGYEASEEQMVTDMLRRKHYDPTTADEKERMKIYRYLASRGFSYDIISDVMAHFSIESDGQI